MDKHRTCYVGILGALLLALPARATSGDQQAYDLSIKCFAANAVARSDAVQLGKKDLAANFQEKAKASFDAAVKFGSSLGYSGSMVQQDLEAVEQRELPKLTQDRSYFQKVAATCRALELM